MSSLSEDLQKEFKLFENTVRKLAEKIFRLENEVIELKKKDHATLTVDTKDLTKKMNKNLGDKQRFVDRTSHLHK